MPAINYVLFSFVLYPNKYKLIWAHINRRIRTLEDYTVVGDDF